MLAGLVDRNTVPQSSAVKHSVIQPRFDLCNPAPGVFDFTSADHEKTSAIDNGVVNVRHRALTNNSAPQWLKDKAGTVTITDVQSGKPVTYLVYWDALEELIAWDAAQAAHFDGDSFYAQVQMTYCATVYEGELFSRQATGQYGAANIAAMKAAGYDGVQDAKTLLAWPQIMASHWRQTPIGAFDTKNYQAISSTGKVSSNGDVNVAFFNDPAIHWGGVNNAQASSYTNLTGSYARQSALRKSKPGYLWCDQTLTLGRTGTLADLQKTLTAAAKAGVSSMEPPAGYQGLPDSVIASANASLAANLGEPVSAPIVTSTSPAGPISAKTASTVQITVNAVDGDARSENLTITATDAEGNTSAPAVVAITWTDPVTIKASLPTGSPSTCSVVGNMVTVVGG